MTVFIIGTTGDTGKRVAGALIRRGDKVAGLYRKPAQASELDSLHVQGHLGDIASIPINSLADAMRGAEAVVFTAGAGDSDDESMIDAVDNHGVEKATAAAEQVGIKRLLLVSVFPEAGRDGKFGPEFEHYIAAKKAAEIRLVRSTIGWIILRPSVLTDDRGTGKVSLSAAEAHTTIARDDLAETIVTLLHTPAVERRILEVTTGEAAIGEEVQALLK